MKSERQIQVTSKYGVKRISIPETLTKAQIGRLVRSQLPPRTQIDWQYVPKGKESATEDHSRAAALRRISAHVATIPCFNLFEVSGRDLALQIIDDREWEANEATFNDLAARSGLSVRINNMVSK